MILENLVVYNRRYLVVSTNFNQGCFYTSWKMELVFLCVSPKSQHFRCLGKTLYFSGKM